MASPATPRAHPFGKRCLRLHPTIPCW
ncbi:hypothetical protein E2C01_098168 [Portunus trituberculatus]|uniref:Uncharacterized protein n=1 Tax=Portunus trituberculatus TaxID=210409 RepID=A0A5B7K7P1_PORTR|nr:hypothetical protein [Portunus trituberculatus]